MTAAAGLRNIQRIDRGLRIALRNNCVGIPVTARARMLAGLRMHAAANRACLIRMTCLALDRL